MERRKSRHKREVEKVKEERKDKWREGDIRRGRWREQRGGREREGEEGRR